MKTKRVAVIGTGYVGLPVAVMLANAGYEVVGIDTDDKRVEGINRGEIHIIEEDLRVLARQAVENGNLKAQNHSCKADVFLIAVPTPLDKRKKIADLSFIRAAIGSMLPYLEKGNLVIVESTIPPLTCREIIKPMLDETGFGDDIMLAHCPERIVPGSTCYEIVHLDRIIGGINDESSLAAKDIYSSFVKGELYVTDDVTAELCKVMENTYRDVNVALANEFAAVGNALDVDIEKAIVLANKHPRVSLLSPGIGVGGHCLPIDPWFIAQVDPEDCTLIYTARRINDERPVKIAAIIRRTLRDIKNPIIVALGATYKPNSDDPRESPALKIADLLTGDGYDLKVYDPLLPGYEYSSLEEVAEGADCLIILVEHDIVMKEFFEKEDKIKALMRTPIVLRF
jgi:UDP-N-acetyl-D-mannosaminuronic acid dehydrogenase